MMNKAIDYIWKTIGFPDAAFLGKRVPKKHFLENGQMVASDKKLFKDNVKNICWEYTLKPSTCSVMPFKNDEREYLEVAVLQIELASQKGHKRIAEIMHRVIPYPLLLVFFTDANNLSLSIAPKRFSQAEKGAFVVERFLTTNWFVGDNLSECESAFIDSLRWISLPMQHYGALYDAWIDRFTSYECSVLSGTFTLGKATSARMNSLVRCREIELKITELRAQMQIAAFSQQVELNVQIKKLEQELKQAAVNL